MHPGQDSARPHHDEKHRRRGEWSPRARPPQFAHHGDSQPPRRRPAVDQVERGIDPRPELLRSLHGGGLTPDKRLQQTLLGQARAACGASAIRSAAQVLGDRAFLFGRQFAVGIRREVISDVFLAVHSTPCLYPLARIIRTPRPFALTDQPAAPSERAQRDAHHLSAARDPRLDRSYRYSEYLRDLLIV